MARFMAVAVLLAALTPAAAQEAKIEVGRPVNKICPIMSKREAVRNITVNYKGKVIGFCCDECVDKFMKNPGGIARRVPSDRDPYEGPKSLKSLKDAIETGKDGPYPVVLLFSDGRSGVKKWNRLLTEPVIYKKLMGCAFFEVPRTREAKEAKQFGVKKFPTLLILEKLAKSLGVAPAELLARPGRR